MRSKVAQEILAETPEETRIFVRQYADIVVRINELLLRKGYTQKDLAEKLQKKPSEINKWLKGTHNITLKTLAKMEAVLWAPIISVPHGASRYLTLRVMHSLLLGYGRPGFITEPIGILLQRNGH